MDPVLYCEQLRRSEFASLAVQHKANIESRNSHWKGYNYDAEKSGMGCRGAMAAHLFGKLCNVTPCKSKSATVLA